MKKITNHDYLKAVICEAANEAFKREVVDTNSLEVEIGKDGEHATEEDWKAEKIIEWNDVVKEKLSSMEVRQESEFDEDMLKFAHLYYGAALGETITFGNTEMTRIPGGWVVEPDELGGVPSFAPFSDEFKFMVENGWRKEITDKNPKGPEVAREKV